MPDRLDFLASVNNMVNIMKYQIGNVIAHRNYFSGKHQQSSPVVEIQIGQPSKSPHAEDEFMCTFRIKFADSDKTDAVFGIDELQALQLALGSIASRLQGLNESHHLELRWDGDENGDLGIRILVP